MAKMWAGRTDGATEKIADDFNSSIHFDNRMYRQDITGSMAHASMLCVRGIISPADADALIEGLEQNQDFFTLLLSNDEIKRQVLGIFTEEIYRSLRDNPDGK